MKPNPKQPSTTATVSLLGTAAIIRPGLWLCGGNFSAATEALPVKLARTAGHLVFPVALALLAGPLVANPHWLGTGRAVTAVG